MVNMNDTLPMKLFQRLNATDETEQFMAHFLALVGQDVDSGRLSRYWLLIALYAVIFLVSVSGNGLVCYVTFQRKSQKNLTNMALGNLAVSDLLITFFNVPFGCARIVMNNWIFGQLVCSLLPFIQATSVYVSSLTMALIAIDRYHGMMRPLAPKLGDRCPPRLVVSLVWLAAMLLAWPYSVFHVVRDTFTFRPLTRCEVVYPEPDWLYRRSVNVLTMVTQFILPLCVTGYAYYQVGKKIYFRETVGAVTQNQIKGYRKSKIKTISMLIACFVMFIICWLPMNLYHLIVDFDLIHGNFNALVVTHVFAMSSVCYNPFIYFWFNDTFRTIFKKKLLHRLTSCGQKKDNNDVPQLVNRKKLLRRKTSSAFAMWYEDKLPAIQVDSV
ncbi:putative G-protein coupled receptor 83 [Halotydeus destructor]|nr:putative G-protein coupled receptor 83 [Halotydeus destructor]